MEALGLDLGVGTEKEWTKENSKQSFSWKRAATLNRFMQKAERVHDLKSRADYQIPALHGKMSVARGPSLRRTCS